MLILPATPIDRDDIDNLLDTAFGPGRHARTASLLRAGAMPVVGPSLVARFGANLLGSVQYWPIVLVSDDVLTPLTLLGPVAVAASARKLGLGRRLIGASLTIADAAGLDPILLIGDLSYYGQFGFDSSLTSDWTLPGPVERHRLLLRHTGNGLPPSIADVRPIHDSLPAARVPILVR